MEDSAPKAYRPIKLDDNTLLYRLTPWAAARLLDREACRLLHTCFPGWDEEENVWEQAAWSQMLHELMLETGETVELIWKVMYPDGSLELYNHVGKRGSRMLLGLGAPGRRMQLSLHDLVYLELTHERAMPDGTTFTQLDKLRQSYQRIINEDKDELEGLRDLRASIIHTWHGTIRTALVKGEDTTVPGGD